MSLGVRLSLKREPCRGFVSDAEPRLVTGGCRLWPVTGVFKFFAQKLWLSLKPGLGITFVGVVGVCLGSVSQNTLALVDGLI